LGNLEKRYGFSINYINPEEKTFQNLPKLKNSLATYYRTCITSLVPKIERIIYLDCDVVLNGDIKLLFDEKLNGQALGAVPDPFPREENVHIQLGVKSDQIYFNAGVLLLDLGLWRNQCIEKKLINFMHNHSDKLKHHDQDALNAIFAGGYKELPTRYNFIPAHTKTMDKAPIVIHFAEKPWYILSALPYRELYFRYLDKTPWRNQKFRGLMDISFMKKYHFYYLVRFGWRIGKRIRHNSV
jgi:lipopolysaccharide biosynthesis glycosyltransferase